MGCFDFTYADNGQNIRGRRGYVYISKALQKATGLPSPMRFTGTDQYGIFDFDINGRRVALDIIEESEPIQRYIEKLRQKTFVDCHSIEELEELIRCKGIDEFFGTKHIMPITELTVRPLANQREKTVKCRKYTDARLPMLITRKKLPCDVSDDITNIARKWGFVTANDPNQGWSPTHDLYCQYRPQ